MPSPKGGKASHVILETRTQSLWDVDSFTPRELERSSLRSPACGPHRLSPASPNLPQFPTSPDGLPSVFYHGFALFPQPNPVIPRCDSLFWCLLAVVDRGVYSVTRETERSRKNVLLALVILIIMGQEVLGGPAGWRLQSALAWYLSPSLLGDMDDCLPLLPQNAPCSLPDLIWRLS